MAQGVLVPSLTMEMLRVVTHSGAILVRADEAGVKSVAVPGLEVPTDRNGQFWVHFNKHDPARYVSAKDVLHGRVTPTACAAGWCSSAPRRSACSTSRRRRSSRPCPASRCTRRFSKAF